MTYVECVVQSVAAKKAKDLFCDSLTRFNSKQGVYTLSDNTPDLNGKKVLIFDDMISTGGTSYVVRELLLERYPDAQLSFLVLARTHR